MKLRDEKIWSRPWFRKLPPRLKCLFDYIVDNCDDVGLWIPDFELASMFIGEDVSEDDLQKLEGLEAIPVGSKLWFPDHVLFQWKIEKWEDLNPRDKFHVSIVRKMRKFSELRKYVEEFEDPREQKSSDSRSEKEEPEEEPKKPKETLEERKARVEAAFRKKVSELRPLFPELPDEEVEKFSDYWTESKEKGKLLLFETKRTFDVKRRLQTWAKNKATNFGRGGSSSGSRSTHGSKVSQKVRDGMSLAEKIRAGKVKLVNGKPVEIEEVQE